MKNIIFCFVIFLLILVRSNVFAQSFDFRAVVVDEENNLFVKNVVVQLVNTEYSILNFSRSAEDGSFIFKNLNVDTDYLLITNHLNYQSDTIPIAGEKSMTIFLKQRINALPEVIVREERQSYQNLGDTTVFDVASFEDGFERSVEEIIAKLPGVKVDESGQITFRGKTVSNVLIDYDDLFGKKYGRGTKSLNPKYITELEFIDRYEEEDLIRGVSNSDKLILNLKLADEFKIAVFGDALLGLGIASRYIGKANVFSFTEKSKGLILGGADNVAYQNLGSALENEAMGGAFDDFHFNRRLSRRSGFNFYGKPGLPTELQSLNVNKSVTGSLLNKGSRLKSDLKLSLFSVRNQFDQFESVNLLGEEENVFTNSFSDIVQNLGGEIFHGLVFNTSATSKIKIHSELSLKDFQTSSLRTTASNEGSLPTLYFTPAKVFRQAHHLEYLHQNKDLSVFHFQYTFLNQSVEEDSFHQFLRSVQASENTLGLQPFTQDLFQSGIDHAAELRWLKSFNPATKGKVSAGFRALQDRSTAQVAIQQSPEQIDREFQSDFSRQIFEKYLASTLVRDINKKSSFAMSLEMSTAELESKNELLLDFASKFQYQASSSTAFFLSTSYFRKPIDAWDISGLSYFGDFNTFITRNATLFVAERFNLISALKWTNPKKKLEANLTGIINFQKIPAREQVLDEFAEINEFTFNYFKPTLNTSVDVDKYLPRLLTNVNFQLSYFIVNNENSFNNFQSFKSESADFKIGFSTNDIGRLSLNFKNALLLNSQSTQTTEGVRSLRQDLFYQSGASLSLKFLPKNKLKVSLVSKLFSPLNQNNFWNNHFLEARAAYVINDRQNVGLNFKNMTNRRNFESIILSPTNRIMTMVELQPAFIYFSYFFRFST